MTQTLVHDLLIILAAGLLAGLVCRWLRVSVLIGYLVVGVMLGKGILGWIVDEHHQLEHFAEAGVFLLLFSIGLEFSLDELKKLGRNLVIGGSVQMLLVAIPVASILLWMKMSWQSAALLASAVSFSSTVLVFKALSECGHSEMRHGRRAIGILLFQDAALIPLLLLVPILTGDEASTGVGEYIRMAAVSILFVVAVVAVRYLLAKWLIPMFAGQRSPELVILFTIVSLGGITLAAYSVGLPAVVGAFAAGLVFNGNRWTKQIDSLVLPFRETFAAIFFVSLGLIFDPRVLWEQPLTMLAMLAGVVGIKACAASIALRLTGLPSRPSVGMGIGLAHVGEFAFVLVLLGLEANVITNADYQRVVSIAVGSLIMTPMLMKYGLRFGISHPDDEATEDANLALHSKNRTAVVIGLGPIGAQLASQLEIMGNDVCLVDMSPINLHPFALEGFRVVAGDATQPRTLLYAGTLDADIIAVCVPHDDIAFRVVEAIRKDNREATLIVRCRYRANTNRLKRVGANRVVSEETEALIALKRVLESAFLGAHQATGE